MDINRINLDNGYKLIEASAGTGKTFTLAHLFLRTYFENQLRKKINEVDTSLIQMLNSELTKFRKALEKIQKKLIANSKKKNDIYYNRVKKIQSSIMKNNVLNERKDSFIQNYIDLGENYIEKLMEESSPLSFSLKIIVKD